LTIGEQIYKCRKEARMTLEELGQAIGVSKHTVQRYESGVISNIPADKIEAMAKALRVTPATLMGWGEADRFFSPISRRKLPVLGSIACGEPVYAEQEHECYVYDGGADDADFCLIAKGDSMIGARIHPGDAVFIRRQESAENGQIAAVIIDGEATLKRIYYYPEQQKLILCPENAKYAPLVYMGSELEQVRIVGVAVAFQSRIK
ncbi:MAG: helix-turn-helix domain-containing protein, partial [Clostridia bacterium]|nr:helix-turn-helix domain-containing protein [Clostridia bacterium]